MGTGDPQSAIVEVELVRPGRPVGQYELLDGSKRLSLAGVRYPKEVFQVDLCEVPSPGPHPAGGSWCCWRAMSPTLCNAASRRALSGWPCWMDKKQLNWPHWQWLREMAAIPASRTGQICRLRCGNRWRTCSGAR